MTHIEAPAMDERGVAWRLEQLYPSPGSPELKRDLLAARSLLDALKRDVADVETRAASLSDDELLALAIDIDARQCALRDALQDIHVYCMAHESAATHIDTAPRVLQAVNALFASAELAVASFIKIVLARPAPFLDRLIEGARSPGAAERWSRRRDEDDERRSPEIERAIAALGTSGFSGWARLYKSVRASLRIRLDLPGEPVTVNLDEAGRMLTDSRAAWRRAAWQGLRAGWEEQQEVAAAILNNMSAWRLQVMQLRGEDPATGLLRSMLAENRFSLDTLTCMMASLEAHRGLFQQAVRVQAALLGTTMLEPWDLDATWTDARPPSAEADRSEVEAPLIPFAAALDTVAEACDRIARDMGDVVRGLCRDGWLFARPYQRGRRTDGFQTNLVSRRQALVYLNYDGRWFDVLRLAHEIGHAHHFSVIRDLPSECHQLPLALSETASSFGERLVRDAWDPGPEADRAARVRYIWNQAQGILWFLLVLPSSFRLEQALLEARRKQPLGAATLRTMMAELLSHWFGDTVTAHDELGWARKASFAHPRQFHNIPYSFGFLLSLALDRRRRELGPAFHDYYAGFLRDMAWLSAEDLSVRHLGRSTADAALWSECMDELRLRYRRMAELGADILPDELRTALARA